MVSGKNTRQRASKTLIADGGPKVTNDTDAILVFAGDEIFSPKSARRGLEDMRPSSIASRASRVAVTTLEENMRRFLSSLGAILATSPKNIGGLALDEVEIRAQIDGKGNIGIAGIVGAELAVQGGITFVLRKSGS